MDKFNLPNLLSLSRLLLAPFAFILVSDEAWLPAVILLWFAIATDLADGFLARRWQQTSHLGGFLDHGSDAVLVSCLLAAEAWLGIVNALLPVLVITAFVQYALDSRILAGQPLRASLIGRSNGILYFVLAGWPIMQHSLGIYLLSDALLGLFAWLLVASTLLSMADRLITLVQLRRVPPQ